MAEEDTQTEVARASIREAGSACALFERYTDKARRSIFFARYEASQLGSQYIETEHLLLGLLREDRQLANRLLGSHAAVDAIRKRIEGLSGVREKGSTSVDMPLSHPCKRAMAYGHEEADRLNHRNIETDHLLLGLLRDKECMAATILREHGVDLATLREEFRASDAHEIQVHQPRPRRASMGRNFRLTAIHPKLSKADPANPSGFHETGFGAPGRSITFLNMTMAQFSESLPRFAMGYFWGGSVVDATGIEGAWDFTLNFHPAGWMGGEPILLFEAVEQQLGLKLEPMENAPARRVPKRFPSPVAEVIAHAMLLAIRAGASEIDLDTLLEALGPEAEPARRPGHAEGESSLASIGDRITAQLAEQTLEGAGFSAGMGAWNFSVTMGWSDEVRAAIEPFGGLENMTKESLRAALLSFRRKKDAGDSGT